MTDRSQFTRRNLFGIAGGAFVAAAVAACGGNTGRAATGSSTAASPSAGGTKPALSQWYHQYGEKGTQQAVQKYAAAYDKATVKVQWTPGDYDKAAAASLLTKAGPDVFEYGNGPTLDMIQQKQVVPLTDVVGDAKSDFSPGVIAPMIYEGEIYGIPQVTDMQLLVYRKSLLSAAGLEPPTSFDALVDAANKLTTKKVKGLFLGNDGGVGVLGGTVLHATGGDYSADGKPTIDTPEFASALTQWHKLFTSGSLLLGAPADWSDPSAITQGLCAMQWTGLWTFPQLQEAFDDDFGVLPFPAIGTSGKPAVPVGAYGSCVNAKSADVDAAKAFASWLWVDQTDDQLDFAQSFGFHIPARKSLADKAAKLKSGPAADAVTYVNDSGHANPLNLTPKASTALTDAITKVVKSGNNAATELGTASSVFAGELKRVGG
jgi:multiple sugar transport system substrate-binding protein